AAIAMAVHPGAARVQHAAHAAVERGETQRLECGVVHVCGPVLTIERRVHGGIAVLQHTEPVLLAREVAEHGEDALRLERLRILAAARETEHLVALARETCRDRTADVTGRAGDEDAMVHGPAPWPHA